MDLTEQMGERLSSTEARLGELLERLEGLRLIEQEHAASGQRLGELATRVGAAYEVLEHAARSLREATGILGKADPARLVAAVEELRGAQQAALTEVAGKVESAAERAITETAAASDRAAGNTQASVDGLARNIDGVARNIDGLSQSIDRLNQRTDGLESVLRELLHELASRRGPLKRVADRLRRR